MTLTLGKLASLVTYYLGPCGAATVCCDPAQLFNLSQLDVLDYLNY